MAQRGVTEILDDASDTLATAEHGLELLLTGAPDRKLSGLRNVIVFGRAVTNVLQNLRSATPGFDKWYEPWRSEMQQDPLLRHFYKLRSIILKEGRLELSSGMYIEHLDLSDLQPLLSNPPPHATDFFIGDRFGGSGWRIELPDGTTETFYVALPRSVKVESLLELPGTPDTHLGQPLTDKSIPHLAELYIRYLRRLVKEALNRFAGTA